MKREHRTSNERSSVGFSLRRLKALCWKETLQIFRDPSSNLIAFVLPLVLIFVVGYGINLDTPVLRIGLLNEASGTESEGFAKKGGTFRFLLKDNKVRFEVNVDTIKRLSLVVSAKLLQVAIVVKDE